MTIRLHVLLVFLALALAAGAALARTPRNPHTMIVHPAIHPPSGC
jgi:hypothetical protein